LVYLKSFPTKKRNKSGLLPVLYSSLSPDEKEKVKSAMKINNSTSSDYFLEPEEFYQVVYRKLKRRKKIL
jgi:hypothetical protein